MQRILKFLVQLSFCLALTFGLAARAEDKKVDLTGSWKSSFTNSSNGQVRETTFKLKVEDGKLTGTVSGRNNDTPIKDGKIDGNKVSFSVTREFNGNTMTIKYSGKVDGDSITGKSESERNGQPQSRDWVAKREKADAK